MGRCVVFDVGNNRFRLIARVLFELGTVEIYKGKQGFQFRIKNTDGKLVAMPPPASHWDSPAEVGKVLDGLKATLNNVKPVEVKD